MKKATPVFNVSLRVDDNPNNPLPYVGDFSVLQDGKLVRGANSRLKTYKGLVDMASKPPLHVAFGSGLDSKYLVRKGRDYYLRDSARDQD